jgi:SAM-dependent methyltransferase
LEVFRYYARYYDLFYQAKSYEQEIGFVSGLLNEFSSQPNTLLELGCGTGRHAEQLAKLGYRVHGVDLSPDMVRQAEERASQLPSDMLDRLSFASGDARCVRTDAKYDAVISLFHVVSYQNSNADVMAMFHTAAEHLVSGGLFVFDCWYGPAVLTDRPHVRTKRLGDEKIDVFRIAEPVMHPNENLVDVNYTVLITDKVEHVVEEVRETHRMRYFFLPELEMMLNQTGFSLLTCREWLTGQNLDFSTWCGTFVARKEQ